MTAGRHAPPPGLAGPDFRVLDDATVIRLSLADPERFELLFQRHAPRIQRYVLRRLGADAADDIVAETFLLAFRQRAGFDVARGDALPWLYGIATNLLGRHRRDEIRPTGRSPTTCGSTSPSSAASWSRSLPGPATCSPSRAWATASRPSPDVPGMPYQREVRL